LIKNFFANNLGKKMNILFSFSLTVLSNA